MNYTHKYLGSMNQMQDSFGRLMNCNNCNVSWVGCWDNHECIYCGYSGIYEENHPLNPKGISSRPPSLPLALSSVRENTKNKIL
jgi:hypothetical protein